MSGGETQIAPGLGAFAARTPTLPPATHTNSYALGTRQLLLVEPATPFEDEQREWLAWARGLASQGRELLAIFVTHYHADHVGGAEVLARELDVPLWGHAETQARLDLPFGRLLQDGDELLLDGPEPQRWQALLTLGHAPGHLCLHGPERGELVVGDMVASEGTILIAPGDGHMATYLAQLERLAALDARLALPAHGAPIQAPTELFRYYIQHRLMREGKLTRALAAAPGDLDELLPRVYDDTPRVAWPLARLSLQAHLEKLLEEGRARSDGSRYHAAAD